LFGVYRFISGPMILTLFQDHICERNLNLQIVFLRFLSSVNIVPLLSVWKGHTQYALCCIQVVCIQGRAVMFWGFFSSPVLHLNVSCLEIIALLVVCLLWVDGWFSTVSCLSTPVSVQRNKTKKMKSFQIVHLWANVRNFDILSLFMIMIPVSFIKKCNMHQCLCYDVGLCVRVYQSFVLWCRLVCTSVPVICVMM